jgi:succinoglycan biosynthesis transport protein ExoP
MSSETTGPNQTQAPESALLAPSSTQSQGALDRYAHGSYGYGYGTPDDGKIHLLELLRVMRKRKWLIITLALVVTTIVTIEIYRTPSTYRASAILEIGKDDQAALKANNSLIIQNDDPIAVSMKTDTIILTSPPLLEEVIEKLGLDKNPRFLGVNQKKPFWSTVKDLASGAPLRNEKETPPAVFTSTPAGQKPGDVRSPGDSERLAPYVGVLQNNLEVEPIKDSRTMKVSFVHTDPAVAAEVANGIAQDFIDFSFQTKTSKYTKASDWLERSTRELKARVEQAEKGLADYTREHNIFSLEGKETLTTDKLSRLHDQETRAETDRILKQSLYEEAKDGKLGDIPEAFSDPKVIELNKTLSELQTKQAELGVTYGPKYPQIVELNQQIESIKKQIEESRVSLVEKLKADYSRSARDEQALNGALATAKTQAVQENQDAIQFNILKQDVDTSKSLYTEFLQKTNQANLDVAQQNSNLRLISPARVPKSAISPDRPLTIFIAFALSLATGVFLAFFLEYLDNSIKSVEDINRYIQLPALGIIPTISSGSRRALPASNSKPVFSRPGPEGRSSVALARAASAVDANSRSAAAEAYRALRTSLLLSTAGSPPKTILVTSGQPGEGKTTTAINTAISLAQLGSSVLVIDCDLRRPSVHKVFGVDQAQGLSTYLSRNVEIEPLIQTLPIPNLSVLPCGAIPPNPAELISSDRMKDLIRRLSERYDHIIIDSPPLINVTDPVIMSTMVDGVMLVVHGAKSTRYMVQRARQELLSVGAKIFGVVLNNIDLKGQGYNDYYYYRYYTNYEQRA